MLAFHMWFVPLVGLVVFRLLRKKYYRDAAVCLFLSLAAYGLWVRILHHHPLIVTIVIADIMEAVQHAAGL